MKKLIYILVMAATFGLTTSCDNKKDEPSEGDIDDITMVSEGAMLLA